MHVGARQFGGISRKVSRLQLEGRPRTWLQPLVTLTLSNQTQNSGFSHRPPDSHISELVSVSVLVHLTQVSRTTDENRKAGI